MRLALVAVSTRRLAAGLLMLVLVAVLPAAAAADTTAAPPAPSTVASIGASDDPVDPPPITVNPFMPAERSLSDCLSVVPKPGCGSEARGGPYQAAVFGAIVVGLGIILTRIVIGVRRNRATQPSTTP